MQLKFKKNSDPGGHIAQKRKDLTALANLYYKADRKMCHLAKINNNQVLLKSVDIPLSGFLYGEEKGILLKYNAVLAALRENLPLLTKYNFTEDNLIALEAQLNKLIAIPVAISVMPGNQRSATRSIKELIDEAHTILDRLDDVVEGVIDDEKFIESWHDARKIKGRRNYRKADQSKTKNTKTSSN